MADRVANMTRINTLLCGLFIAAVVGWGVAHYYQRRHTLDHARHAAEERVRQATSEMDISLNRLVPVNIALSEDLTTGNLAADSAAIEARLRAIKTEHPRIFGIGVAFAPFQYRPGQRLYAPLFVDREDGPAMVQIEDSYDYTSEDRAWYQLPLKQGPVWQEPHYGIASQSYLANFTSPFFGRDPQSGEMQPRGVVFTSMSINQFDQLIASLGLYETGYGFLTSRKGAFVAHPNRQWVENNRTVANWANETGDAALQRLAQETLQGRRSFAEHIDPQTGKHQWVFIEPIISTGWCLGMVFEKDNIEGWAALQTHRRLLMMCGAAAFVWLLLTVAMVRRARAEQQAARASEQPLAA